MNFKKLFYSMLFCAVASQAAAQVTLFNKTYDDYNAWEVVQDVYELEDSSVLLSSSSIDFFATDSTKYRKLYFSKLSKSGVVISKESMIQQEYELGNSFSLGLLNGRLLNVVGYSSTDTNNVVPNKAKGFYFSSSGHMVGNFDIPLKTFSHTRPAFVLMAITTSGTFVTVAKYSSIRGDSSYLFASDSNGNILWLNERLSKRIEIDGIVETSDKGFILSGQQTEEGIYVINPKEPELIWEGHPERLWYAKVDSVGKIVWEKLVTGDYYELYDTIYHKYKLDVQTSFRSSIRTADGNYVLAGYIAGQPYMTKINEQGERLWQSKYFKTLSYLDTLRRKGYFYDVKEANGYLYALGQVDSLETGEEYPSSFHFLMKLTGTGRTVWTRYFKIRSSDYLYSVTPGKGCFYLAGSRRDTTPGKYGNQDAWIIKVDEYGCEIPGCQLNDVIDTSTAINDILENEQHFMLYPNPTSHTFTIQSDKGISTIYYTLYNYSGQHVFSGNTTKSNVVNVESLQTGLYIIELKDEKGRVIRKKMLKE